MRFFRLTACVASLGVGVCVLRLRRRRRSRPPPLVKLQGAGASFPAPLYGKWFKAYSGAHQNVQVDYQSVGSGGGVKSVIDHTVDFGASDAAMTPQDMAKVDGGVQLFPMTAGSIVLAYNLKDVDHLKLSRQAYAGVFLGKVKRWNDPLIADGQSRREAAGSADQRRGARRQQRHVVRVFQASERDQRGVQHRRWRQHDAQLAGRHQVQGQRRRHREHHDDARVDRLHRVRVREKPEDSDGRAREQGRQVRGSEHGVRTGGARVRDRARRHDRLGVRSGRSPMRIRS